MWISTMLLLAAWFCPTSSLTIHENGPDVVRVDVKEGSDVVLPCSLSTMENIALGLFDWRKDDEKEVFMYQAGLHYNNGQGGQDEQFKGRVFHFPEEVKHGNASIMIRNTKKSDSGNYTCDFPHLQPSRQKFNIELVVHKRDLKDRSGETEGATPKPSVTTLHQTKDWALLQCVVQGVSPKPKVEWQDSSGNILPAEEPQVTERGGSYDIILKTTVTKSDNFSCVVTQEEISHQTKAATYVYINEKRSEDWAAWFFGGWGSGVVTLAVVQALLVAAKCITISPNKGSPPQTNGSCNGSSHVPLRTQLEP